MTITTKLKICNKCGVDSNQQRFYQSCSAWCVECYKERVRNNRRENFEYYKAFDAQRDKTAPRKAMRAAYRKTERGKTVVKQSKLKWVASNPLKNAAHVLLNNSIKSGRITRPSNCSVCEISGVIIHGHHSDYSKPLEVTWVCAKCHFEIHRKEKENGTGAVHFGQGG